MKYDISKLDDKKLCELVENRWNSSQELWNVVKNVYEVNTSIYENKSAWLSKIPHKRPKVQANRVFVNMESVINSLIANPSTINVIPSRSDLPEASDYARKIENFFKKKYQELNVKEVIRMGLRNLYFGRLLVLKPFWNPKINDFDVRALDPRKVRISATARRENDSEFTIEEVEDTLCAVATRFPEKKKELMQQNGITDEADMYIKNPIVTYKEAWIGDYVIFKHGAIILGKIKNPYWDWDGVWTTKEEQETLGNTYGDERREALTQIKAQQAERQAQMEASKQMVPANEGHSEDLPYEAYYYNYFDQPRKPYIIATIFNNENCPVGRTDMITLASTLQQNVDKRKQDIDENCELVNGIVKIDSQVMDKSDAQQIRFEAKGIIWGKGVVNGVQRETGAALPQMVFDDMLDSREEIDNIMAASSAFRGEREGQETKAGRLALIQQSYLRLNELVQTVDYVSLELFGWFFQLAKTRYTELHYAKWLGKEEAAEIIGLMQDDFDTGSEVIVIPGKSLPQDAEFQYEQAQIDAEKGFISPADYLEIANYPNPKDLARNAVLYQQNPAAAVGLDQSQMPMPEKPGELTPEQQMQQEQMQSQMQMQNDVTRESQIQQMQPVE